MHMYFPPQPHLGPISYQLMSVCPSLRNWPYQKTHQQIKRAVIQCKTSARQRFLGYWSHFMRLTHPPRGASRLVQVMPASLLKTGVLRPENLGM